MIVLQSVMRVARVQDSPEYRFREGHNVECNFHFRVQFLNTHLLTCLAASSVGEGKHAAVLRGPAAESGIGSPRRSFRLN